MNIKACLVLLYLFLNFGVVIHAKLQCQGLRPLHIFREQNDDRDHAREHKGD